MYTDSLEDDAAYFIGVKLDENDLPIIGEGTELSHLNIHVTSRFLMGNLSLSGVHHIDATYKITTYGYPLIVNGVSDAIGKFHPASFMVTSHETEDDFSLFYDNLINEAERLDVNYEPEFIMQDACPASKNALIKFFPNVKFLMCYFHVKKNVREKKHLLKNKDLYRDLQNDLTGNYFFIQRERNLKI